MKLKHKIFFKLASFYIKYILRTNVPDFYMESIYNPIELMWTGESEIKMVYRVSHQVTMNDSEYPEVDKNDSYLEKYTVKRDDNGEIIVSMINDNGEVIKDVKEGILFGELSDIFNGSRMVNRFIFRFNINMDTYKDGELDDTEPIKFPLHVNSILIIT